MSRANAVSLTDAQLAMVRRHAAGLPIEARDRYLRSLADGLGEAPSDEAVMVAIDRALRSVEAFNNGARS